MLKQGLIPLFYPNFWEQLLQIFWVHAFLDNGMNFRDLHAKQ